MTGEQHRLLDFFVPGIPLPEGSLKAIPRRGTKQMIVIHEDSAGLRRWRHDIAEAARYYMGVHPVLTSAVAIECRFTLARPKTVRRLYPTVPPDLDKLARSCGDAIKGVVVRDDAQIVNMTLCKRYEGHPEASPEGPGVRIIVREFDFG